MDNDGNSGRTDPKEVQTGISIVLLKSKNQNPSCWIGIQHQSFSYMKDTVSPKTLIYLSKNTLETGIF